MSTSVPDDLWKLSAGEVAALIRKRAVSATEAVRCALERLDAVNPSINAVVDYRPEDALAHAERIDRSFERGDDPGPLAGVPVTIKTNIDQKGYATVNGLKAQKDLIAQTNSPVVDNLLKAGAVPLGRTNVPAFCYRWFTDNRVFGATKNPRDPSRTPGGSSGGAAASVAAGIGHIAHGTDIAGSIRYPAYACGVHGLRPSLGRVAAYNASGAERGIGGQIMAVSGPLARTVNDVRLGLAAMSGADPRDPWWVPAPLVGPDRPRRAAVCFHPDGMEICAEVRDALVVSAERLRDAGWVVDELDSVPPLAEAVEIDVLLWMGDGYDALVRAAEADGDPGAIAALAGQKDIAGAVGREAFSKALKNRLTITREWLQFTEEYPVVLLPPSAEPPFPVDLDLQGPDAYQRVWRSQMPMIALPVTGLPVLELAVSNSIDEDGAMPSGIQIVASRYREDLCLAAGEAIESRGRAIRPIDPKGRVQ